MRGIDDTDREILHILLEDARTPFSDIAEAVDLSAPAVSDRVDRLQEIGLLQQFTVDLDRELLEGGTTVLVTVDAEPGAGADLHADLAAAEAVERVFRTADDRLVCTATVEDLDGAIGGWVDLADVRSYDVRPLAAESWTPNVGGADLAPACDECGNTVTREGETVTLDGDTYHFCCENCRGEFVGRYEQLKEGA